MSKSCQLIIANSQERVEEIIRDKEVYNVSEEDIATIPHPEFREIATSFQESLAAIRHKTQVNKLLLRCKMRIQLGANKY